MPFNEAAFQRSVDNFAEFLSSGKLQRQEWDYKEKLIRVLGAALTDEALASAAVKRFDDFDVELNKDYDLYIEPKKRSGWLTALLLTVRYPQKYTFYRHRLIKFAKSVLGYEIDESGSRGERYLAYIKMVNFIKDQFSDSLGPAY